MRIVRALQIFLAVAAIAWAGCAKAETVRLASLEWPPYSSSAIPGQGASIAVARAAFEAMGHSLQVDFFPWSRTIWTAQSDDEYVGYAPEYFIQSDQFVLSDSIGFSPLGFAERIDYPVRWQGLDDLSEYRIGIVQDYVNTPELDTRIRSGAITASVALTDSQNLLKLAAGRTDLAVIDRNVMDYLMVYDRHVASVGDRLRWNPRLLSNNTLHVAFNDTPEGRRWLAIFNEGLSRIDAEAIASTYLGGSAVPPMK